MGFHYAACWIAAHHPLHPASLQTFTLRNFTLLETTKHEHKIIDSDHNFRFMEI
jgi:hypothetical protein